MAASSSELDEDIESKPDNDMADLLKSVSAPANLINRCLCNKLFVYDISLNIRECVFDDYSFMTQIFQDAMTSQDLTLMGLSVDDLRELLLDSDDVTDAEPRTSIIGYPSRPLYRDIASLLSVWIKSG